MARSRFSHETGSNGNGKRHGAGRVRERAINSNLLDSHRVLNLDECLNLEKSAQLQEMLERVKASSAVDATHPRSEECAPAPSVSTFAQLFGGGNREVKAPEVKRLFIVTITGSVGPLRVVAEAASSSNNIVSLALQAYAKEGRLPNLGLDCAWFDLFPGHLPYGEPLGPTQSLKNVGCRYFVMQKRTVPRSTEEQKVLGEKKKSWLEETLRLGGWLEKILMLAYALEGDESSAINWMFGTLEKFDRQARAISSH